MRLSLWFGAWLAASACRAQNSTQLDLTQFVLPDTGAIDGGNTFPGVGLPFGMVKLGPDLYTGADSYSGYQSTGAFTGFSLLHESGTGGAPKYGVVAQMPVAGGAPANPLANLSVGRRAPDAFRLGAYRAALAGGVDVRLAATERTGLYAYAFPAPAAGNGSHAYNNSVVVDVSHVLPSFRGQGLSQNYLGGHITVESTGNATRYTGAGSYDNGWNRAPNWTVYFCGHFDQPATYKTFLGQDNSTGDVLVAYDDTPSRSSDNAARLGAVFTFHGSSAAAVTSRVGVSFVSTARACANVEEQIPAGTAPEALEAAARAAWSAQVLSRVTTTDASNTTRLQMLYSSLYHMLLMPANKTGENPLWQSDEPYYDDFFTLWDLHRCTVSLWHLLQPAAYEEMIRALIDIWRHEGYLPDARSSLFNGATQGGSNADNVLADAFVKGVRGAVDWTDGFAAMVTDAEVTPANNDDPRDPTSSTKEGRGALPDWKDLGYVTTRYGRSVSRSIEYAANDFALYQVAAGLNRTDEAAKYLARSRQWRNQWNADLTALNFTGFLGPRAANGSWLAQDPLDCGGCYWSDEYYEAKPIEYSFNAHHDVATLIEYCGGADAFVARLEAMFTPGLSSDNSQFGYTLFNPGNEPSFTTPYLFNFVPGHQHRAVYHSRSVADSYYAPTPGGLPGNSDAGAMESWLLWSMIGLYPLVGQTTLLIGSPWFSDLTIDLGPGGGSRTLVITAANATAGNPYVQSLAVNGAPWDRAWVAWDELFSFAGGEAKATLDFVLGPEPLAWDTGAPPPSPAMGG
ncbi:family 92 glycoside hydrolase [Xylariaceae sp. FL0804]|nr:family 92 glycoside hydrolase [Xylariaceae sp. FL0804]